MERLPLHFAVSAQASVEVVRALLEAHPEGAASSMPASSRCCCAPVSPSAPAVVGALVACSLRRSFGAAPSV